MPYLCSTRTRQASQRCSNVRVVFLYVLMANKTIFNKTYKSPKESIEILRERGLSITDESKAQHYLSHIGYYRLSAYMHPLLRMPKEEHLFKEGASFDKVMTLYRFDKKLRMLLFNEIEKIEVAVRCSIVNCGCEMTNDPFWITDASNFSNPAKFNKTIHLIEEELIRSKEDFVTHFKEIYSNPYPPAWILMEVLPFGVVTNIYANIKNKKLKKRISQSFDLQVAPFEGKASLASSCNSWVTAGNSAIKWLNEEKLWLKIC